MKSTVKESKIRQARQDIAEVLNRYRVTLPEVMKSLQTQTDEDEKIWKEIEPTMRKIRKELFFETYPDLYGRKKKSR